MLISVSSPNRFIVTMFFCVIGSPAYGPQPGIKTAMFEVETPEVVGNRIRVTNLEGSSHVEEIVEWQPDRRIRLEFKEFSPLLSKLATTFEEIWDFERLEGQTRFSRFFRLHAKSGVG